MAAGGVAGLDDGRARRAHFGRRITEALVTIAVAGGLDLFGHVRNSLSQLAFWLRLFQDVDTCRQLFYTLFIKILQIKLWISHYFAFLQRYIY